MLYMCCKFVFFSWPLPKAQKSAGAGHRAVSLHRDCVLVLYFSVFHYHPPIQYLCDHVFFVTMLYLCLHFVHVLPWSICVAMLHVCCNVVLVVGTSWFSPWTFYRENKYFQDIEYIDAAIFLVSFILEQNKYKLSFPEGASLCSRSVTQRMVLLTKCRGACLGFW